MADDRRMTTDRFYGGVSDRLDNLRSMFEYIRAEKPSRLELNQWIISNTRADSEKAVSHHLTFLQSVELIELSESCILAEYGERWLNSQSSDTLYEALSSGVKGFDTIMKTLQRGSMTDEEIMKLLVSEFEEAEMSQPGPAIRHREWLQTLGYIEHEGKDNRLTPKGRRLLETINSDNSQSNKRPHIGETITAKIDRVVSGNGIIEFKEGSINVGPVREDAVGKTITAKRVSNVYGVCKTPDVVAENYWTTFGWLERMVDSEGTHPTAVADAENLPSSIENEAGDENEIKNIEDVSIEHISKGVVFTSEIDRISSSGNGIIEKEEGHINIGPVIEDAVGSKITARMEGDSFARCMSKNLTVSDYDKKYEELTTPSHPSSTSSNSSSSPDTLPPIDERSSDQSGSSTFCSQCGSLIYLNEGGNRICSSCGYKESDSDDNKKTEKESNRANEDETITEDNSPNKEKEKVKNHKSSNNFHPSGENKNTSSKSKGSSDKKELRKKAEEESVEEVPQGSSTTQHNTPTYNRSQAVKDYVKARADGICEGCGDPAPFVSKAGEPYLHAHHIHELSDGGSDTPDTVVALCPNCHYQVHHGADGDRYNKELLKVVQSKETNNE